MTDKVEIQGKTVDEAVSEALLRMGARRDEVDVTVLEEPRTGFLGLVGNRPARVIVRRRHTGGRRRKAGYLQNDADHQPHDLGGGDARGERGRGRAAGRPTAAESGRGGRSPGGESRRRDRQAGDGEASRDEEREKRTSRRGGRRGGNDAAENEATRAETAGRSDANGGGDDAGAGEARSSRRRRGRRGGRGRSSGRRDQRQPAVESERENASETTAAATQPGDAPENREDAVQAETGDPGREVRSRRGRSRGGRGGRRRSERSPAAEAAADETPAAARNNDASSDAGPIPAAKPAAAAADELIATGIKALSYAQPQKPTSGDALDGDLTELASGMLVRAGFPCRCEVKPGEYRLVKIVTDDTSAGMLIGRHGQTIDAVEHLVERMISTAAGDRVRMNLDINNYRRRRQDSLVERVAQAVAEVQATGNDVHLEPMDARERRICHLETALTDGLRTWTVNGPGGKHVVIGIDDGTEQAEDTEPIEIGEDDESDANNAAEHESAPATDRPLGAEGSDSTETVLLDADSLDLPDDDGEQERPGAGS